LRADNKFHEEGVYLGEEARMSRGETLPISGYRNIERVRAAWHANLLSWLYPEDAQ